MRQSFAFALTFAMASAQQCCPKSCPTPQDKSCCQSCPDTCDSEPSQPAAPILNLASDCSTYSFGFSTCASCAEITELQVQCLNAAGEWQSPKATVAANASNMSGDFSMFSSEFNLQAGDNIYCQYRYANKNGYGYWSVSNDLQELPACFQAPEPVVVAPAAPVQANSCATLKRNCVPGPDPKADANPLEHTHKYCHVDQTPKFVKKTKWVNKTVHKKVTTLEPKTVKRMTTVEQIEHEMVPDVLFEPTEVKQTRKVTKTVQKEISKPVTKTRTVQKAVTEYEDVPYDTFQTVHVDRVRKVKKVRMVPRVEMRQKVVTETQTKSGTGYTASQVSAFATQTVQRQAALPGCDCYQKSCGCVGQQNCDCCFPKCDCAPNVAEAYDILQTKSDYYIVNPYDTTINVDVPKIVEYPETVMVPETYFVEETVRVPELRTVTKTRSVPKVSYVPETETYTDYVTETVPSVEEVDEDFTTTEVLPRAVMTSVKVKVPTEIEHEFTEMHAVTKTVPHTVKVPITTVARLPAPACHWHSMTHAHGLVEGQTHNHSEDHDHTDCVESGVCNEVKAKVV